METSLLIVVTFFAFASSITYATESRFAKRQAVLNHFGVTEENSFANEVQIFDNAQTRKNFDVVRKYVDPKNILHRYANWDDDTFTLFQDRDEKQVRDYSLSFSKNAAPSDPKNWIQSIRTALKTNPSSFPFQGLKIAIDPGHMGGMIGSRANNRAMTWDVITGKYVRVNGRMVSEGTMALQTCLLLSRELEKLGAEVILTRYNEDSVSALKYDSFDMKTFANEELKESQDTPWFDALLSQASIGDHLFKIFDQSQQIRKLHTENMRQWYFVNRADLRARSEIINAFKPNLTLFVHFDADQSNKLQNNAIETRSYVPGNILDKEIASREQRYHAVRTLFDPQRWLESYDFSAAVVSNISRATGIKPRTAPDDIGGIRVKDGNRFNSDGVYARNLALNHLVGEGVAAFLEVLSYDYEPEFRKLSTIDRHTSIDTPKGPIRLDYSSRLDDIVAGMKQGFLEYALSVANH